MKTFLMLTLAATMLGGTTMLGGCASIDRRERRNMSPDLWSVSQNRRQFRDNRLESVRVETRELRDDFQRFRLRDTPSTLSEFPIH